MTNENPTNEDNKNLDHLQDDFNSLISEDTPSEGTPYAEPADAFNDLAGAFAADDTNESSQYQDQKPSELNLLHHGGEHDDFVAHLNKSINELKATASTTPAPITEDELSHEHSKHPDFGVSEFESIQDTAPFNDHLSEQVSESLFEDEVPVYADLSGDDDNEGRPKSHIIAFASAILVATAGGIYWYTMGATEQPNRAVQPMQNEQVIEGEQLKLPKQATPKNNTEIPKTLSTADAIKLVTQQHAQQQTAKTTAVKTIKPKAVKQTVQSVSIAQPVSKHWMIVAAVSSNKLARQYMARLRSKQLDSEIVQLKSNGKTRHFIRIKGFNSQHSAQKKRDSLVEILGLQNARVQSL